MKYIIDLPTEFSFVAAFGSGPDGMPITKEVYNWTNMEPYTEPDRKDIEDAQEEAWEFAKQVSIMKPEDKEECWGTAKGNTINLGYHYKEAKAAYDKWKKDRDEIKVGNEVEYTCCDETVKFVVMDIVGNRAYGFKYPCEYDESGEYCDLDYLRKTGRHFPQVEELLKAMKGESDDVCF